MPAHNADELEAIQIVADRVGGYQDGAPVGTVEEELRRGLSETGIDIGDTDIAALAAAIEGGDGTVDVSAVLERT